MSLAPVLADKMEDCIRGEAHRRSADVVEYSVLSIIDTVVFDSISEAADAGVHTCVCGAITDAIFWGRVATST